MALMAWLVGSGGAGLIFVATGGRAMFKLFRRVNAFLEDWNGVEARPGVEKRPGVMERLDHLQHEVSVNSGKSLKDLAVHTKDAVTDLTTRLDDHLQTQHER